MGRAVDLMYKMLDEDFIMNVFSPLYHNGRFSWSMLTAEEKNATIGDRATNNPSESEFATFTEVLTTGGRIGLDLASGIGQTRYNNDLDVVRRNT